MTDDIAVPRRRRDAAQTRQVLLDVARHRFARDGYTATTVRDIADEAGVNVALISRYFTSKEGLFEACLTSAISDVRRDADDVGPGDVAHLLARRLSGSPDDDRLRDAMLLLVRSSGDERIEGLRRSMLRSMSEKLAARAGHGTPDEATVLRAQILLASTLGIILMKSTLSLQPLSAAEEDDLRKPLSDMVQALLPRG
ncbi:TetR family transcriptional regulator [Actinoplanes sp. GCM10030250]|uniref:TetR/AcrR family transcriptional regulator n=1 Tax=Actinoplanes sp. GCM10030250 TaxID=3273376 RepID=UPI003606919A